MRLASLGIGRLPPFDELRIPFYDDKGAPRPVTVLYGGGGVGKTTLVAALAQTRPGHAAAFASAEGEPPYVVTDWLLGCDDPERPHALRIASPSVRTESDEQKEALRRKEQALFDKRAREGGFAFLAISSLRWFSKQPLVLSAPARTLLRYDVRAPAGLDDASRADLSRETKQALAYSEIVSAVSRAAAGEVDFSHFANAMREAVNALVGLAGFQYIGIDPVSLEPWFEDEHGATIFFDALPTRARHLTAFAALPVRMLFAAYPGREPRAEAEGVVVIDEVDLHQDSATQSGLVAALKKSLPSVQWILTTSSPHVTSGCESEEVFALRRLPETPRIELFSGPSARVH